MGKKPVLGIVGAFCVGLTLTGCRDANTRSEGAPLAKDTRPAFQTHPSFGPGASNTTTAGGGWNKTPDAKATPAASGMPAPDATPSMTAKPSDPPAPTHTDGFGVQPAGGTTTAPPAPIAPDLAPRPGPKTDWSPTPATSSKITAPMADMPAASGRMLPPTPGQMQSLPPLPEPPAPIPPRMSDGGEAPPPPPAPLSRSLLPSDAPPAPPGPSSLPMSVPAPVAAPMPLSPASSAPDLPLPPPPPVPAPPG